MYTTERERERERERESAQPVKIVGNKIAKTLCYMHQSIFGPNYILSNDAYFLDFRANKFLLIFLNLNHFQHQEALLIGVLNY